MIMYSIRARSAKAGSEPAQWAKQVAQLVEKRTGIHTDVATRLAGTQDIVWVTRYDSLAQWEKASHALLEDSEYQGMLKIAQDRGLFVTETVEAALWQGL
ncbi:hypothetical protein [Phenylobacterium montanum]|uniref:Uncharacterized protein n=1 Tax=Phenylobacterium montanum TaxID=2823693 RepID=A0A975IVE2_9CAUL|nr:hypothetical protein [Caulobacter sp. S6]QUD88680.1 hypothetical protein KCG34_01980 [Caulobacter sp. S6]